MAPRYCNSGAIFLKEIPDRKTWVAIAITFVSAVYIFYDSLNLGNLWRYFGLIQQLALL